MLHWSIDWSYNYNDVIANAFLIYLSNFKFDFCVKGQGSHSWNPPFIKGRGWGLSLRSFSRKGEVQNFPTTKGGISVTNTNWPFLKLYFSLCMVCVFFPFMQFLTAFVVFYRKGLVLLNQICTCITFTSEKFLYSNDILYLYQVNFYIRKLFIPCNTALRT